MWSVIVRVPRSVDADVAKYRLYVNGILDGEVAQPPSGDAQYTYHIPADGDYRLTNLAVDADGNEGMVSDPMPLHLDHLAPSQQAPLTLVSVTWVP